jgi:hypothetical protein
MSVKRSGLNGKDGVGAVLTVFSKEQALGNVIGPADVTCHARREMDEAP